MGEMRATNHRIFTAHGARHIFQSPYQRGLRNRDVIEEIVKQQLNEG